MPPQVQLGPHTRAEGTGCRYWLRFPSSLRFASYQGLHLPEPIPAMANKSTNATGHYKGLPLKLPHPRGPTPLASYPPLLQSRLSPLLLFPSSPHPPSRPTSWSGTPREPGRPASGGALVVVLPKQVFGSACNSGSQKGKGTGVAAGSPRLLGQPAPRCWVISSASACSITAFSPSRMRPPISNSEVRPAGEAPRSSHGVLVASLGSFVLAHGIYDPTYSSARRAVGAGANNAVKLHS